MLTQDLIHLQTVIQGLPFAVYGQRDRRLFQEVDELAFPLPAGKYPHVKARVRRLFDQIQLTLARY